VGDEKRALTMIVGRDYSTTALITKRVADILNTKNDGLISNPALSTGLHRPAARSIHVLGLYPTSLRYRSRMIAAKEELSARQ